MPERSRGSYRIWIDTGGTFTDAVAATPDGRRLRVKLLSDGALRGRVLQQLSSNPTGAEFRLRVQAPWLRLLRSWDGFWLHPAGRIEEPAAGRPVLAVRPVDGARAGRSPGESNRDEPPMELLLGPARSRSGDAEVLPGSAFEFRCGLDAPVLAAHLLTATALGEDLPPCEIRLATTLGTNALLEHRGTPPAFFVTRGFGDLLRIGDQRRPDLFALRVEKRDPLHGPVIEVDERLDAMGNERIGLNLEPIRNEVKALLAGGVDNAAIALLHAYRNPVHERRLRDELLRWGFRHVSCSSDMARSIRLVPRATTAVVDAFLAPTVSDFLNRVQRDTGGRRLFVMTSAGGLLGADDFRPKDSLLSGPAGGVVGAAAAARKDGSATGIGFDMGGTSTDVSRWDHGYEYVFEHRVGDAHVMSPALAVETVAAGGGSICWFDGQRLRVGPHSSGSNPGPACYGAGGPLTLTDVNLLLGRIDEAGFGVPLTREAAEERWERLRSEIGRREELPADDRELLAGFLEVADERMADAIREVSLRRGYDPSGDPLVAFGGAAGQHACSIAARLEIDRIFFPPDAALLSAIGLGRAERERFAERQILRSIDAVADELPGAFAALELEAMQQLQSDALPGEAGEIRSRRVHLRFTGQDHSLEIPWSPSNHASTKEWLDGFIALHRSRFGHVPPNRSIEVEMLRVVAALPQSAEPVRNAPVPRRPATTGESRPTFCSSGLRKVPVYRRSTLQPGDHFSGPAIVLEPHTSLWVDEGWEATVRATATIELIRVSQAGRTRASSPPIQRELFTQRFRALVGEMGAILETTAVSVNVKERLDFSCALLDPAGELVVNAPHVPVHLGALGLCVREVVAAMPDLGADDHIVTNHPGFGGSHLPDVTVISPVHSLDSPHTLLGYVASRAHHAEIGGMRPGSMPPQASRLEQEGVVLSPQWLVHRGQDHWDRLERTLRSGAWPSRNVEDNLADLRAAVAANHRGRQALQSLGQREGTEAVHRAMAALNGFAAERLRAALRGRGDGSSIAEEAMDDGTRLRVQFTVRDGEAHFDFSGSAAVHPGNLNATPAIVRSAVVYVLRLLVGESLPLNEGLLNPVRLTLPRGILRPDFSGEPKSWPAVVGGNTETSQRLVDTLLKAIGAAACSQGTMNNVIFGTDRWAHYETVAGGSGATAEGPGASAVHTHMTNTRITDPEVLEHRYPVRLDRFTIRAGSGGAGIHRGGNGVVREYTFLEPVSLSLVTQHRTVAPYGIAGGEPGALGRQVRVDADGGETELASIDGCEMQAGDRLVLETPGGGGFGKPRG